jgi:hypothetical protein
MTKNDRKVLAGEKGDENRQRNVGWEVERRINGEVPDDVAVLAEHWPELFEELCEVVCDGGMTDEPRDYDREFTTPLTYRTRRRIGYSHDHGDVTRFMIQLEYRLPDGWAEVVRFDHDPEGEQAHDVTTEGVHMDVHRGGEKIRSPEIFPPMPASNALTSAEEHLTQHGERYIKRFEEWHEIGNR